MKARRRTLHLQHFSGLISSKPISIKCGIFQEDSLSPLLFCLALAPLSSLLSKSFYGYVTTQGRMGDLQTFAKNDNQQKGLLTIVKTFSGDVRMEFGVWQGNLH